MRLRVIIKNEYEVTVDNIHNQYCSDDCVYSHDIKDSRCHLFSELRKTSEIRWEVHEYLRVKKCITGVENV